MSLGAKWLILIRFPVYHLLFPRLLILAPLNVLLLYGVRDVCQRTTNFLSVIYKTVCYLEFPCVYEVFISFVASVKTLAVGTALKRRMT